MTTLPPKSSRDESLDFTNGILIILVVLGHAVQFIVYAKSDQFWFDPLFRAIYLFHMPAFIVISGIVVGQKIVPQTSAAQFFAHRIVPILIPLLIWSFVIALPFTVKAVGRGFSEAAVTWVGLMIGAYWFLWSVIIGSALAWLASRFGRHSGLVAAALGAAIVLTPLDGYAFPAIRATVPFYLAGYMLGRAALSVSSLPLWAAFGSGLIAAVGALFWQRQTYVYNNELAYWTASNLGHIALMALMWILATIAFLRLAVATFSGLRGTIIAKAITNLGKHTLEIYLVQGVAFTVVAALPPLSVERPTGYLIAVAVTAALVAGIPAVASHLRGHHVLDLLMWGRAKRG